MMNYFRCNIGNDWGSCETWLCARGGSVDGVNNSVYVFALVPPTSTGSETPRRLRFGGMVACPIAVFLVLNNAGMAHSLVMALCVCIL